MSRRGSSRLPRTLSARDIHEGTGIPLSTVYAILARKEMPVVRYGDGRGSVRVLEDDFREWLAARREVAS